MKNHVGLLKSAYSSRIQAAKECRDALTGDQSGRARATNINLRTDLGSIETVCDAAIYVNADFPDGGGGTTFFPFDTVPEAVVAVPISGCLIVGTGVYPTPVTFDRAMTVYASLGTVRIGG